MCPAGAMVASGSLTKVVAGSNPFTVMTKIFTARVARRAKVMFSQASVCSTPRGGRRGGSPTPPGQHPSPDNTRLNLDNPAPSPGQHPTPAQHPSHPGSRDQANTSGRYASYWNAFLLSLNSTSSVKTFSKTPILLTLPTLCNYRKTRLGSQILLGPIPEMNNVTKIHR